MNSQIAAFQLANTSFSLSLSLFAKEDEERFGLNLKNAGGNVESARMPEKLFTGIAVKKKKRRRAGNKVG